MTTSLQNRLGRLRNRPTKYELVASHPDGRRVLIAYTARKGRTGIYHEVETGRKAGKAGVA